jgi:nucleoid-associated protein YgaU
MGKEAKVGIVVIGVLMGALLGLVIKKYFLTSPPAMQVDDSQFARQAEPISTADQPTVVTAQNDLPGVDAGGAWSDGGAAARGATAGGPPNASFLPAVDAAAPYNPNSRYAQEDAVTTSEDGAPPTPVGNPFDKPIASDNVATSPPAPNAGAEPDAVDPAARGEAPLNARRPGAPGRNPLRRLSAEVPLQEAPNTAQPIPSVELNPPTAAEPDDGAGTQLAPETSTDPLSVPAAGEQIAEGAHPVAPSFDAEPDASFPAAGASGGANEPQVAKNPATDAGSPVADPALSTQAPENQPPAERQFAAEPAPGALKLQATRPADGRYTIQPNDSLWTISEKVYGDGKYFKALGQHNKSKLPHADRLTAGTVIDVPTVSDLEHEYPDLCPRQRRSAVVKSRSIANAGGDSRAAGGVRQATHTSGDAYVVVEGDTLFDIARYELGKASRWGEIYELNRDVLGEDFDYLPPGLELRMPPRNRK